MAIHVRCPSCAKAIVAPDTAAGKKAKCPGCGKPVEIPAAPTASAPTASAPTASAPTASAGVVADDRIQVACPNCGKRLKAPASLAGGTAKCPQCQTAVSIPAKAGEMSCAPAPLPAPTATPAPAPIPVLTPTPSATDEDLLLAPLGSFSKPAAPQPLPAKAVPVPAAAQVAAAQPAASSTGTINVPCPSCGKTLKAPAAAAGKKAKCPACGSMMSVPERILEAEEVVSGDELQEIPAPTMLPQMPGYPAAQAPVPVLTPMPVTGYPQAPMAGVPVAGGYPPAAGSPFPAGMPFPAAGSPFPQAAPSIYSDDDFATASTQSGYGVAASTPAAEPGRHPCPQCGEMIPDTAAKCRYCGAIFDSNLERTEKRKKKRHRDEDSELSTTEIILAIICAWPACILAIVWMIQGKPKGGKMLAAVVLAQIGWFVVGFAFGLLQAVMQ